MTSTDGCTNAVPGAQILPPGYAWPVYRDASGACFAYEVDGSVARYAYYGYDPSEAAAIAFLTLFALLTLVHLILNIVSRRIWLVTTVIGGVGEIIGWVGRYRSSQPLGNDYSDRSQANFLINVVSLSICPTFFSATCYGLLVLVVRDLGSDRARIRPRLLAIILIIADAVAILIQGAGGGLAGGADTFAKAQTAARVLLAGIVVQLACMVIFTAFTLDYVLRARTTTTWTWRRKLLVGGLLLASVLIIIRGAYRSAELKDGFLGDLAKEEPPFLGADAAMMVLCMLALAIAHPAITLPARRRSPELDDDNAEKL